MRRDNISLREQAENSGMGGNECEGVGVHHGGGTAGHGQQAFQKRKRVRPRAHAGANGEGTRAAYEIVRAFS